MSGIEALVAVGLASNIVQFADFASRLVSHASKLYNSGHGRTPEHQELELLVRNLQDMVDKEKLQRLAQNTMPSNPAGPSDPLWEDLSCQCSQVTEELLRLLKSLEISGESRGWESAYRTIRTVWKKEDLDGLQKRLDAISNELKHKILWRQQTELSKQMKELAEANDRLEASRASEIKSLNEEILEGFKELQRGLQEDGALTRAWMKFPQFAARATDFHFEQFILGKLRYNTMHHRHSTIHKEHTNTFNWIFQSQPTPDASQPSTNFVQWLRSGDGPFWVSGKPGSGKSTLMKFISSHPSVRQHLSQWARISNLLIANYFFWSSAKDPLQKSQNGLLRSILYQIFRQCPELIPIAFSDDRAHFETTVQPMWPDVDDNETLLSALRRIADPLVHSRNKFVFFIDGLDEYSGRPADVIDLINTLRKSTQVKLCISSRPWNEFNESFGEGNQWKLYVHELTKSDIRLFVEDRLGEHRGFRRLRQTDSRCPDLVEDIVNTAQGVFLWVYLVVRSLLEGLTNADRIVDLQARLKDIPSDLEEYFKKIIFTVEPRYREQMARTFLVALEARCNLPVLAYWFIDEEEEFVKVFGENQPAVKRVRDHSSATTRDMRKRLNARCKGLLEADRIRDDKPLGAFDWEVGFLHRTVADFLAIASMQDLLQSWSSNLPRIGLKICTAIAMLVKCGIPLENSRFRGSLIPAFFNHVRDLGNEDIPSTLLYRLLDELKNTMKRNDVHFDALMSRGPRSWTLDDAFPVRCIIEGVYEYVNIGLQKRPSGISTKGSLLMVATLCPKFEEFAILELLLRSGINPNAKISLDEVHSIESTRLNVNKVLPSYNTGASPGGHELVSVWVAYLRSLIRLFQYYGKPTVMPNSSFQCLKALLARGADHRAIASPNWSTAESGLCELKNRMSDTQWQSLQETIENRQERSRTTTNLVENGSEGGAPIQASQAEGGQSPTGKKARVKTGTKIIAQLRGAQRRIRGEG